jgi:hypothetical protein
MLLDMLMSPVCNGNGIVFFIGKISPKGEIQNSKIRKRSVFVTLQSPKVRGKEVKLARIVYFLFIV